MAERISRRGLFGGLLAALTGLGLPRGQAKTPAAAPAPAPALPPAHTDTLGPVVSVSYDGANRLADSTSPGGITYSVCFGGAGLSPQEPPDPPGR
jgi:hypothetical protein